jgi:hypothetical protein
VRDVRVRERHDGVDDGGELGGAVEGEELGDATVETRNVVPEEQHLYAGDAAVVLDESPDRRRPVDADETAWLGQHDRVIRLGGLSGAPTASVADETRVAAQPHDLYAARGVNAS